jgi:type III pantothenate kinase
MIVAVDVGNTNVVFALVEPGAGPGQAGEIKARWRIATDPRRTADQYSVWLHQLFELEGFARNQIEGVIIGSVVPRALHNLEVLSEKYFRKTALVAGQGKAEWPLQLDVDEPHNVGADRALNVIAAHAKYPGDKVIIDFGTATTFDVADASGAYKGGIIAPGINLSIDALVNAAAMLPRIAIEAPEDKSVVGRTTERQMLIGIYWGYVAMIEGLVERLKGTGGTVLELLGSRSKLVRPPLGMPHLEIVVPSSNSR